MERVAKSLVWLPSLTRKLRNEEMGKFARPLGLTKTMELTKEGGDSFVLGGRGFFMFN